MNDLKQPKNDLDYAAENAVRVIGQAATEAARVVANAAEAAAKVVASAAAESIKVVNEKGANDHDLLIELKTRMEGLKTDIKDLNSNTSIKISDHEKRLFDLEKTRGTQTTLISIGIGLITVLIAIVVNHIMMIK